jgi:WD40 repeat protein
MNAKNLPIIVITLVIAISCTVPTSAEELTVTEWRRLTGYSAPVSDVEFSPLGSYFALVSGNIVELYDKNWNKIWEHGSESNTASALTFSPDEGYLLLLFQCAESHLLQLSDKTIVQTLPPSDSVGKLAFSPDSTYLAIATDDGRIKIWQFTGNKLAEFQALTGHLDDVRSVAFSSDATYLASGSDDNTIKIWHLGGDKFAELQTLTGHSDYVTSVAFSPTTNDLASGSEDHTVKIWKFSGADFAVQTLAGHSDYVTDIAFSPVGGYLASASEDRTIKIWQPATAVQNATLTGHSDYVTSVAFSPDGDYLASASEDGVVIIWSLRTAEARATKADTVSSVPDTVPPVVEILSPLTSQTALVEVVGVAKDNQQVTRITVNGKAIPFGTSKDLQLRSTTEHRVPFRTTVSLADGRKSIRVVVVDSSGLETDKAFPVTIQPRAGKTMEVAERESIASVDSGERWALLIGVDRYNLNKQQNYYLPNLQACVKDVTALDAVLRDVARGGFEHVTTLVTNETPGGPNAPTDRNILKELKELVDRTEADDLVLIYFSGHGLQHEGEAYLLPENFEAEFPNRTALRSADLTRMINQMKAKKVVTIIDACHSGGIEVRAQGGKAGGKPLTLNKQYHEAFNTSAGKVVLHSCDVDEKSWELLDRSQGVFSKYLVDGLLGAADAEGDNDGVITIQEAYQYVHKQVVAYMRQDGRGKQTPVITGKLIGKMPLTVNPARKRAHQLEMQINQVYTLITDPVVADRAIALLKKHTSGETLTENEQRLIDYLHNLLAGEIALDTYLGAQRRFK